MHRATGGAPTKTRVYACIDCGNESILDSAYISHTVISPELDRCMHCESSHISRIDISQETMKLGVSIVSGVKELHRVVPDGFKEILRAIQSGAPRGRGDVMSEMRGL